ncbi:hypothetical protein ANN_04294 [Periplaneta americana]|uniref:HAT C-terminal dimerisation domain-containing protein n=1 Tax=Periplaneta americana TaxID=6978 RepID=A0ABQ8T861_PERAM|nr:hypothetical protein ANN_04294 [Periplaneta americana]
MAVLCEGGNEPPGSLKAKDRIDLKGDVFFMDYSLEDSFSEVDKALRIALTTPVSTVESERSFSTLNRIKTFLRNTMGQDRLNSLAFCSIHKEYLHQIPNFKNRVIEKFAS